jgi:integrase
MHTSVPQEQVAGATSSAPARAAPTMTLLALVDAYMAAYEGRDHTRAGTLTWWCARLGSRPFAELTDDDVFAGLEALRSTPGRRYVGLDADGAPIHRATGRRAASTVNRYHFALAAVFTWSIQKRLAPRTFNNPCRRLERTPEANGKVEFLTDAECARLLEACRRSSWPLLYLIVLMAITTGARRGELLALTWADIDLERAIALVKQSKNDHPRALPLVPAVIAELARFRIARPEACVFPSRSRLTVPRAFEASWQTALKEAKIRSFRCRFHSLRHTCASYLAQEGASLLEIADVMGHRQLAMVKRYAHLTTGTKAKLVNRVLGGIK